VICADTSSFVAMLQGEQGSDVEVVLRSLVERNLFLAPVSVAELLSDPDLPSPLEELVLGTPQLEIFTGYWERAGRLRAKLIRHRYRPGIADSLVAQSCLDHQMPLVTRDREFTGFQRLAGLRLLLALDHTQ
jgi:predicted nucleic acid-binding protein